jgi:hypothetical protein
VTPRRRLRSCRSHLDRLDAVDQLRTGDEGDAQAGQREQDTAIAWIVLHVMKAALHRAHRDGIGHQERLEPRLDGEESGDTIQHVTNR